MDKKNFFVTLAAAALFAVPVSSQTIDVKGDAEPFTHYWSVGVGAGRANEGLRVGWLEHLKLVKDYCGFQYVRMHGLFGDDMFVYFKKPDGRRIIYGRTHE